MIGSTIDISYVVCAVQRSGSSFLCELLKSTRIAGMPEEYFLYQEQGDYLERGWWAQSFGVTRREDYLPLVWEKGRTDNGVFGTKMMWNYFSDALGAFAGQPKFAGLSSYAQMAAMLSDPKYIWIVREDKVRQAVSWAIAAQTDIYAASQGDLSDHVDRLKFEYEQINLLHRLVLEGEAGWSVYFEENNVIPIKIVYEDLVANPRGTVLEILEYLGVAYEDDLLVNTNPIRKQATRINDVWLEKYLRLSSPD